MKYLYPERLLLIILTAACGILSWGWLITGSQFGPYALACLVIVPISLIISSFAPRRSRGNQDLANQMEKLSHHGRRLAMYDQASGVLANWYFLLRLDEEISRSRRHDLGFIVLTIKSESGDAEAYGAEVGRGSNERMARAVTDCARATDLVGSLGVSSFAIGLVQTDRIGAYKFLRRVMSELDDKDCLIGMAVVPQDVGDGVELLSLAKGRSAPWKERPPGPVITAA